MKKNNDILVKHNVELSASLSNFLVWLNMEASPCLVFLKEKNYIQHGATLFSIDPAQARFLLNGKAQGTILLKLFALN